MSAAAHESLARDRPTQQHINVFEDIKAEEDVFQLIESSNGKTTAAISVPVSSSLTQYRITQCFEDVSDSTSQKISKNHHQNAEGKTKAAT